MNERIKELANQAGIRFTSDWGECYTGNAQLERFAELIRADEREQISHTYLQRTLEAVLREREACAITAWSIGHDLYLKHHDIREVGSACATAIRARGE